MPEISTMVVLTRRGKASDLSVWVCDRGSGLLQKSTHSPEMCLDAALPQILLFRGRYMGCPAFLSFSEREGFSAIFFSTWATSPEQHPGDQSIRLWKRCPSRRGYLSVVCLWGLVQDSRIPQPLSQALLSTAGSKHGMQSYTKEGGTGAHRSSFYDHLQPLWLQPCPGIEPDLHGVTFRGVTAHSCARLHLPSPALKPLPCPVHPQNVPQNVSARLFSLSNFCSKQFLLVALCNSRTSINHS